MNEEALLDLARDAAWSGAAVVERHARHVTGKRVDFDEKGSAIDLVTAVDRESEHSILAVLRRSGLSMLMSFTRPSPSSAKSSASTRTWSTSGTPRIPRVFTSSPA